ncbi:Hypothetical predicted protein [Octopus vulgaris]|uniref:Uncharacterized protein n=1 Tax=Octopus vulgaris TaxID=6645 RepID=A0AA36F701_OCTVU|nr:Hypothetical predicted protein [Octopus vulgaris]
MRSGSRSRSKDIENVVSSFVATLTIVATVVVGDGERSGSAGGSVCVGDGDGDGVTGGACDDVRSFRGGSGVLVIVVLVAEVLLLYPLKLISNALELFRSFIRNYKEDIGFQESQECIYLEMY